MTDFVRLLAKCKEVSTVSAKVVDEFLIYYAASREGLEKEMDQRLARFRMVTTGFQKSWINLIKAQYICHRIFKENGLIKKYLTHAAVKALPEEQQIFLQLQSAVPWRYSYSIVIANPKQDFYEMEDVFNEETFLLYSPSISRILSEHPVALWFNLIAFNGSCWQSYGPVMHFKGLEPVDIFFFSTELNPGIDSVDALMEDIEGNPFPYLMLLGASNTPFVIHGDDQLLHVIAEHPMAEFNSSKLKKAFVLEYSPGVYRMKPSVWSEAPHFATAYYDEKKKMLLLTSLTDGGFQALVDLLNKNGIDIPDEPDIRVNFSMLRSIKEILGKDVLLNPYEKLFEVKSAPADNEVMARLNRLLSLALPYINSGQEPDVEAIAKEAGVDIKTAKELLGHSIKRINTLRDTIDKKKKK